MNNILKYKNFLLEFKETSKNTPVIFSNNDLTIKVVKTFDSCKELGKDTSWCSNNKNGFYYHNSSAVMYRFIFSDGFKLRLTWDYISHSAYNFNYSGGTHWGSGGNVDGEQVPYYYIRPRNEEDPFILDYDKGDNRQDMVDRIRSIPKDAVDAVKSYQNKHSNEKSDIQNKVYKEIEKIKVIGVNPELSSTWGRGYSIDVIYNDKKIKMDITINYDSEKNKYSYWVDSGELKELFKLKYLGSEFLNRTLKQYLVDKSMELIKKSDSMKDHLSKIKMEVKKDDEENP